MLRLANWRYVFFVGVLPALVTFWIRRRVPESEMWQVTCRETPSGSRSLAASRVAGCPILAPAFGGRVGGEDSYVCGISSASAFSG